MGFHEHRLLLLQGGSGNAAPPSLEQLPAPIIIYDNITATTVDLYVSYVSGATYVIEQDLSQIYSGSTSTHQATGLSTGTYSFRAKVQKSGYIDSDWVTLSITIPTFYNVAAVSPGNYAKTAARQTALETGTSGTDRAFSVSAWVRISNITPLETNGYLISNSDTSTNQQWGLINIHAEANSSSNQVMRFALFTTAANFIYVQTASPVPKNRWLHVVGTYDGSETAAGLELYINGVLEASPTRNTTGSYTGGYDNANLRFKISHDLTSRAPIANLRDVVFDDQEFDQTDVDDLYGSGTPVDVTALSWYSGITAFYPLTANVSCANNATYNLTNTGVSFGARAVDSSKDHISFKRSTIGNTRYVAFGGAFKNGSQVVWYGRSGTSHLVNGKIVKIPFTIATEVAGAPVDVITDGTYDLRGGSAGIIGSNVFKFLCRYNGVGDVFIDTNRYVSTDGLTGATFGAATTMTDNYTRFNFYGEVVTETIGATTYTAVPYYGHNGAGTWKLSVYYTTDAGSDWTKVDVSDAVGQYGEAALVYQDGIWLMLTRRNDSPYGIYQTYSTDNMATWSAPALTNLSSTGGAGNCAIAKNSAGRLQIVIMDRSDEYLMISKNNLIQTVISSPTGYTTPAILSGMYTTDSFNSLGYPNIVRHTDEEYFISYSSEFSSSRADHYFGFGTLNEPI
jgi:hypothetical protein